MKKSRQKNKNALSFGRSHQAPYSSRQYRRSYFLLEIISGNTNIPVILTDEDCKITAAKNVDFSTDSIGILSGKLKDEFSVYKPIEVVYGNKKGYLFYKESKLFTGLHNVLNDLINSFDFGSCDKLSLSPSYHYR